MSGIVRGGHSAKQCVGGEYFLLAGEIKNLWLGTGIDCSSEGISGCDLVNEWFRVEQESKRIEVIEQRGCVVHCKMNFGDSFLIRRKKAVAMNDEMRKYARKIVFF